MIRTVMCFLPLLFLLGGKCDSGMEPVLSTKLDHISSGALVSCDSYIQPTGALPLQLRTCLVLANPVRPLLRVFDVSEGNFLLSPIGYSPLGVRVNGLTTGLLSFESEGLGLVFNLDANLSSVSVLNSLNATRPSFSRPEAPKILEKRPLDIYFDSDISGDSHLLATFFDGSIQKILFDTSTLQFGVSQLETPTLEEIIDTAYDPDSDLLVQVTANQTVLLNGIGANPTTFSPISFVGKIKIALGQINSAPHLLIMYQDEPKLRIIRLDATNSAIVFDNTITLRDSVTQAYFPKGASRATCCGGATDWLSVGSERGLVHYLTSLDIVSADKADYVFVDVSAATGTRGLVQILGGDVKVLTGEFAIKDKVVCPRQMFFLFASGSVASVCEGAVTGVSSIVTRNAFSAN